MEHLTEYPVRIVCRVLNINEQRYYYRRRNPRKPRYTEEEKNLVKEMFIKHNRSFGRRMLKVCLERDKIYFSEKKISNIMKELGLIGKYGRPRIKNVYTCEETSEKYVSENIYNEMPEEEQDKVNAWAIDFTEQKTAEKKVYTCAIIDIKRKVLVGNKQSFKMDAQFAVDTLEEALRKYGKPDMILSDRGPQFTSKLFQATLKEYGIISSMSRPYRPVDNIFIETFFKSMKTEIGSVKHYTVEQYKMIVEYWVNYYNTERPHSSIGYLTPHECFYGKESFCH